MFPLSMQPNEKGTNEEREKEKESDADEHNFKLNCRYLWDDVQYLCFEYFTCNFNCIYFFGSFLLLHSFNDFLSFVCRTCSTNTWNATNDVVQCSKSINLVYVGHHLYRRHQPQQHLSKIWPTVEFRLFIRSPIDKC